MNLSDYAQALGAAQNLVPSYDQLRSNALAIQGQQLQNRAAQQEIAARDQAIEQQQRLASDIGALGSTATPEAYRTFALRYPQLAKPLLDAAGSMEVKQREQVVRDSAQIRATIAAGKPEIGAQLVQRHIDADIAAGKQPDPEDQALVAMLKSGDQSQLKAASGILYATLASFDPDSAAKNVGEYASPTDDKRYVVGRALVDQQGNALYRDPEPAQYRTVSDGQTLVEVGGGDPASGSAGSAGGGSGVPRNVRNNNPGNIIDSAFARSQPGYVGSDGRFARFADPAAGQAAQGALLASYIDRGFNTVGKIINRWAPPSENDTGRYVATVARELGVRPGDVLDKSRIPELQRAITRVEGGPGSSSAGQAGGIASGGARIVAQGAPKQRQAPAGYQYKADGETLEPIPGGPADKGRSGGGKALPDSTIKRIEPKIEARDQLTSALGNFRDDYAGHSVLGDASNAIQSLTGLGATGQRDWWAQFRSTDNVIRNQLFGASLTDGEKQAYNATTITPRMAPSEIRRNLQSRIQIVNKALARQRNILTKNGFSQEALGALFDPVGEQQAAPTRAAPPRGGRAIGTYQGRTVYQLPDGRRVVAK